MAVGLPNKRIGAQPGFDPKTVGRYLTVAATAGVRVTAAISDQEVRQVLRSWHPAVGERGRELQNVIERAVVATKGRTLQLPERERRIDRAPSSRTVRQVERDHIVATKGVVGGWDGAAARLGLSRTTLISRMQRLGISAAGGLRNSPSQPAFADCDALGGQPQVDG